MLQLQQYERRLKAMVAHNELSVPRERLQAVRDDKAGWILLFEASHWIAKSYPEQTRSAMAVGVGFM
jgi:hypothetical protein